MLTLGMARAYRRDLLATLVALSLGVAVSAAALLVAASAEPEVPRRYAAAAALVRAPAGGTDAERFPEYRPWDAATADALAAALRGRPGVADAVPVRTFYAQLVLAGRPAGTPDPDDPEGRSWAMTALAPYGLSAGRAPTGPDEVAVSDDHDVRVGQQVPLLTGPGERRVTVTGLVDGPGIYLPDDRARTLGGGTTLIGVTGAARPADLRPVLPAGATLLTGDDRASAEPEGTARTRFLGAQLLTLMLALTCFAAVFVVSQTFALAASHRRRDVALLRALGGTPGQVQRMLLREAAAVGLAGSAAGAALGVPLAPLLGRSLVRAGLEPVGFGVRTDPRVLAGLVVLGPLLAVVATWATGRRAGRTSPLEALRSAQGEPAGPGRWRLAAGILAAAGGVAAAVAAATAAGDRIASLATVSTLLLVAALTWLGPVVLPPLVRLLTWPLARGRRATGMLVRGEMTTAVGRTTATMAPVLVTVAFATLVLGYVETGRSAYGGRGVAPDASAVVAPAGTPGLAEDSVRAVRALAGQDVRDALPTQVFVGGGPGSAAVPAAGLTTVPAGRADVAADLAAGYGWQVGRPIPVTLADGTRTTVRVRRIAPPPAGAQLALPRALVRRHDASALTPRLVLTGTAPDRLRPVVRPGVQALSPAAYARVAAAEEYRLLRMFVLVALGLALAYTLLSVANTLLMATAARARDLGLLRRSGATPGQVLAALTGETVVTVAIGTALGLAGGLAGMLGISAGLGRELGRDVPAALPWALLGVLAAACVLLAVLATLGPVWRAVRRSPAAGDGAG